MSSKTGGILHEPKTTLYMIGGGMVTVTASMADVLAVIDWKTKEVLEARSGRRIRSKNQGERSPMENSERPDLSSVVKLGFCIDVLMVAHGLSPLWEAKKFLMLLESRGIRLTIETDRARVEGGHAQRRREEASEADGTGTGGTVEEGRNVRPTP